MKTGVISVVGIYHVILVVLFAYLFFNLWPAPWPPEPEAPDASAAAKAVMGASGSIGQVADGKQNKTQVANAAAAEPAKVPKAKAESSKAAGARPIDAVAAAEIAGRARRAEKEAADPHKYETVLFGGWLTSFASFEQRLILIVLIAGGLGAYIHAASSLADFVGNQKFK